MSVARTFVRNTVALGTSHVASKFFYLLLLIYITRILGDAGFGRFAFALAFASLFVYIADLGLSQLATRDISRNHNLAPKYLGAMILLKIGGAVITLGLIALISLLFNKSPEVTHTIWIFGIAIVLQAHISSFLSIFFAHQKMGYVAFYIALEKSLMVILGLAVLLSAKGLIALAWMFVIADLIVVLVLAAITFLKFAKPIFKIDLSLWKRLLHQSWPFILSETFKVVYFQIGIVLLAIFWPDKVVGWYGASLQLVVALLFISQVLNMTIFPMLSQYYIESKTSLERATILSVKLIGIIGLPIAAGATALGRNIIVMFYQGDFLPAVPVLAILSWAVVFDFIKSVQLNLLNATDRQHAGMSITTLSTIFMVVLSLILIPFYSLKGAAYAILVADVFAVILLSLLIRRGLFKMHLFRTLWRPAVAAVIMGLLVWQMRELTILISIPVGAIIYGVLLFLFRSITPDELKLVKEIGGIKSLKF